MPTLISMDAIMTFHVPYSSWPPCGVTTNENHYIFMLMEIKLTIPCFLNCCTHVGKMNYDDFLIQKPINY
jgi:hypothetical protein